jgi:hypothetical protein
MKRKQKREKKSKVIKIKPKIFSTIIETNLRQKKNNLFNQNQIKSMYKDLKNLTKPNNTHNGVIQEFLLNFEKHLSSYNKKKGNFLKKKIAFDDNLLIKIIENPEESLTIKEIKNEYIKSYPNYKFSYSTLRRHLKFELGFSFKKSNIINERAVGPLANLQNLTYIEKFLEIIKENHEILYLDESSFTNNFISMKSWKRKNSNFKRTNTGRLASNSVMAAIYMGGILQYEINEGRNKSDHFVNFMNDLETKLKENEYFRRKLNIGKMTIILDNATIHRSKFVRKNLKKNSINRLYLPPYKPQLNPIELLWNVIKMKRKRKILKTK